MPAITGHAILTFMVDPPDAEVTVDGQPVTGKTYTVDLVDGRKTIKVIAKAKGYSSRTKHFAVTEDMPVVIKLHHASSTTHTHTHTHQPPGGLIDL